MSATTIQIGINRLYPGEKIPQGDPRHGQYHGGFVAESHTLESLVDEIRRGHAFCAELGGCERGHHGGRWCCRDRDGDPAHCGRPAGQRIAHHFKSAQHLALDIDSGNPSTDDLMADPFISRFAALIYPTISWTPEVRKWRVVFLLSEAITDASVYRKAATGLLDRFDTSDQAVKDAARLFYGMKPGNGEPVVLDNILPMTAVLALVSAYDDAVRERTREADRRQMPPVPPGKVTGSSPAERYVSKAIEEERSWLASRPAVDGERYPAVIPTALRLESLRLSDWLSPGVRAGIDVHNIVMGACADNGILAKYGEDHLRKAIDWAVAHTEPRSAPVGWSASISEDATETWPALMPLPRATTVPSLPPPMVPESLRNWLVDAAARTCLPLEFVVVPALGAAGTLVGRSVGICPWRFDDYLVVPNLWGGIVGRPGVMKSFAVEEGSSPLRRLAAKAGERFCDEEAAMDAHRARIEAEIAAIKGKIAAEAKKGGSSDTFATLEDQLAGANRDLKEAVVTESRYMTQDATVEKLGELLRENSRGLQVQRDELAGWLRTMDRPGHEGDREFYLEAWNGTGSYTFDRIGRGTVHIEAVTVSIMGGIQPGKLNTYIREAVEGGWGADGLLQRLQLLVWPDDPGPWMAPKSWPDRDARNRAFAIFEKLDDAVALLNEDVERDDRGIPFLRFTPDAQCLADAWREELETRLRSKDIASTPAFESHLSKYRSLMPSLALLFHLIDVATGGPMGSVSLAAAQLAAAWCEFLEVHACKVYAVELVPGAEAAQLLAVKIQEGVVTDGQTVREIYEHHWRGLATAEAVRVGLDVLSAAGWTRVVSPVTGGRPTELVRVHPDLRCGDDE